VGGVKKEISAVSAILFAEWDPIGVADAGHWAEHEYDSYAAQVVGMLARGDGVDDVADYLAKVRAEMLADPAPYPADATAALAVVDWYRAGSVGQ
jgi:hypothetical protein